MRSIIFTLSPRSVSSSSLKEYKRGRGPYLHAVIDMDSEKDLLGSWVNRGDCPLERSRRMLRHPYTPPVEALHLQLSSDSSPYLAHTLLLWMRDQLEARRCRFEGAE